MPEPLDQMRETQMELNLRREARQTRPGFSAALHERIISQLPNIQPAAPVRFASSNTAFSIFAAAAAACFLVAAGLWIASSGPAQNEAALAAWRNRQSEKVDGPRVQTASALEIFGAFETIALRLQQTYQSEMKRLPLQTAPKRVERKTAGTPSLQGLLQQVEAMALSKDRRGRADPEISIEITTGLPFVRISQLSLFSDNATE